MGTFVQTIQEVKSSQVLDYVNGDRTLSNGGGRIYINSSTIQVVSVAYQMIEDTVSRVRTVTVPGYAPGRAIKLIQTGTTAGLTIEAHY